MPPALCEQKRELHLEMVALSIQPRFPWLENDPLAAREVKDGGFALGNFAATSTGHIEVWFCVPAARKGGFHKWGYPKIDGL